MDELERAAHACLLPGFEGTAVPSWLRGRVADGLGGVVLYARNITSSEQLAALTRELRELRSDVLVTTDEEGGDVTRLEAATGSSYPGNLALGQVGDVALTREVAAAIGRDLNAVGIGLDLAPVADVNSNPDNPVIGVRSFGDRPEQVAAHVAAFVQGLQSAGVAACAKHFPGHGDTSVDSHFALPSVDSDVAALQAGPLQPFRAAIAAGVQAIMTAHVVVRAYDLAPATISRRVVTGLLRDELGFEGLVVTDAIEMRSISATVGIEKGTVEALAAGADAVCLGRDLAHEDAVAQLQRAIIGAIRNHRLSEGRLAEAAGRIQRLAGRPHAPEEPANRDRQIGLHAARRAIRAEGNVRLTGAPLVVEFHSSTTSGVRPTPYALGMQLAARDPRVDVLVLSGPPVDVDRISNDAAGRPLVLVVRDLHRQAWARLAVDDVLKRRSDAVVVEVGVPNSRPGGVSAYLRTFGAAPVNSMAAAELLLGGR